MIGLPYGEKNCYDMLSRFHLIPERYGQTDRRTDDGRTDRRTDRFAISLSRVSMLTRDKNLTLCVWRFSRTYRYRRSLAFDTMSTKTVWNRFVWVGCRNWFALQARLYANQLCRSRRVGRHENHVLCDVQCDVSWWQCTVADVHRTLPSSLLKCVCSKCDVIVPVYKGAKIL